MPYLTSQNSRLSHFFLVGSLRFGSGDQSMLRVGTLADLLVTNERGERRILNVDLPMGGAIVPMPPQYRCVYVYTSLTTYFNCAGI